MNRRGMLAAIHIARKDLGLDEETYRAVLERVTGSSSAAVLGDPELALVLDEFRRQGWKPRTRDGKALPQRSGKPEIRKLWAVWGEMHRDGIVQGAMRPGLRAFVKRQTGVTDPEWLTPAQARTVIESLKRWQGRELARRAAEEVGHAE